VSALLTLEAGRGLRAPRKAEEAAKPVASPWRDLREGMSYVRHTPHLFAVMCLAFFLNCTAFPLMTSLQPYVAKEVYGTGQTGLGYLIAGASLGALVGSLALSRYGSTIRAGRVMIAACVAWYALLLVYARLDTPALGIPVLILAGCASSVSQIPMATLLLRTAGEQFRGRVMGIRMLAIYGNLPGLLLAGPLIAQFGYAFTATLYCVLGMAVTIGIGYRWRFWDKRAPANRR
jgi:hypothetical protein